MEKYTGPDVHVSCPPEIKDKLAEINAKLAEVLQGYIGDPITLEQRARIAQDIADNVNRYIADIFLEASDINVDCVHDEIIITRKVKNDHS